MIRIVFLLAVLGFTAPLFAQSSTATVSFSSAVLSPVNDKATPTPFSGITVSDTDSVYFDPVRIEFPTSHGTLALGTGGGGYNLDLTNGEYRLSKSNMTASDAQGALRGIKFTAVQNRIPMDTVETNDFIVTVTDINGSTDNATVSLPVTPANDAPNITLPTSVADITDKETSFPFANITISDVDSNDTVTVEVRFPDVRGSLATSGSFVKTMDGTTAVYTLSSRSPTNASTYMAGVEFTPAENRIPISSDENTTFTVKVTDAGALSDSDTVLVNVTPVNDAPGLSGTMRTPVNDNTTTNLFPGFVVTDVDNNTTQRVVVTVSVAVSGESGAGVFTNGSGAFPTLSFTNTPAGVTTSLQSLLFAPLPNRMPVGSNETVTVSVLVRDLAGLSALANQTNTLTIISINDPPTIAPFLAAEIGDGADSQPFTAVVSDKDTADLENMTVTIAFTNPADNAIGSFTPTNVFSGTKSYVETAIRNMSFSPVRNSISGSRTLVFRFTATDSHAAQGQSLASLTIFGENDRPEIRGVNTDLQRMTDDPADFLLPFAGVEITDPDGGQTVTVVLSLDDATRGKFSTNSISGTPAAVTAALRAVVFSPLRPANRVVGQTVNLVLSIRATDSAGAFLVNDNTRVAITSVNGAPRILGVPAIQPLLKAPVAPVLPFSGISVVDDDTNAVTVSVTMDNSLKGSLSNLNGFVETVAGTYQIVTNQEAASMALSNLAFVVSESYVFPANAPGGTVFTIRALDSVLNLATKTVSIILQYEPRNVLVTRAADDMLPGSLRYAVAHCENNGFITFALQEYPATLQLDSTRGPISLVHNVNFRGPGADRLAISGDSNGDGTPDTQLFRVLAFVTMEGMTLAKGLSAQTGGACYVGPGGSLVMRYCAVTGSEAMSWGGAIDVEEGALSLEGCLIQGNSTSQDSGEGGGAISLWTDEACSFVNTTFSGNRQRCSSGIAGGAIYAENFTSSTELDIEVRHCTFAENEDAKESASAIMSLGFGTAINIGNSVFMDGRGRNLGVEAAGEIRSQGGNLSDDSTRAILIQESQSEEVILFNSASDQTNASPAAVLQFPLDGALRPAGGYRLKAGSPAISHAVAPLAAVDQRGVWRDSLPDSGAVEYDSTARIVLNEIQFDPQAGHPGWLEFYVPRDSSPVDLGGLMLLVDGATNHTFASPQVIQPGRGLIVAGTNGGVVLSPTNNPIPVVTSANLVPKSAGTIALLNPARSWMPVQSVNYLGTFADPVSPTQTLAVAHNSITLAPQFAGFAYVPHSLVLAPPQGGMDPERSAIINLESPGSDTSPMMFGSLNALPQAQADRLVVGEDDFSILPVLANDMDADGLDWLAIYDLSPVPLSPADRGVTNSLQGAVIMLDPGTIADTNATPLLRGTAVTYDPRHTTAIQALPAGAKMTDSFIYTMVDIGSGAVSGYAATGTATAVTSPAHRLTNDEVIVLSGCDVADYNGAWPVIPLDDDTFSIPVPYAGAPLTNGTWETRDQRQATGPATAGVTVEVLGANDYPVPAADWISANEDTVLRVMADATLAGATGHVFETDASYSMKPVVSMESLLTNDGDPDLDDNSTTLTLVGVLGQVHAITNYEGVAGVTPVTVRAPGHGLADGTVILISGYEGHPSYNGYQAVAVVDADTFTIPVHYVDNAPVKGCWGLLTDAGRLQATSRAGASVRLDLRAAREETSVIYDPTSSAELNRLAAGETATDTVYCAVSDSHGAVSIGEMKMLVAGRNDQPVAENDPVTLDPLAGWPGAGSLADLLPQLTIASALQAASGETNRADVRVQYGTNALPPTATLLNLWVTDEDTPLVIDSGSLLANDHDVDTSDMLMVQSLPATSHEGATLVLGGGAASLVYNPAPSSSLNALARNEFWIDSFNAVITDQQGGSSTALVAVLVVGRDDSPIAHDDTVTTPADVVLTIGPGGGVLTNDVEYDINGWIPDNRPVLVNRTNSLTVYPDVWSGVTNNSVVYNPTASRFLVGLADGQTVEDVVPYTMMDGSFVFANEDLFSVSAGASNVVLEVLANDRNFTGSGGILRVTAVGAATQGGTCVLGSGATNLVYTPAVGFVGDDVLTYVVDDGQGNSDRAQVVIRVTVNRMNGLLRANADNFAVARGEAVVLDVLANDHMLPEGSTSLVLEGVVSAPTAGGEALVSSNRISYAPSAVHAGSYPYSETFSYAVSGGGSAMATGAVTIVVINRQGALEVRDDAFSVNAGSLGSSLDVLLNDGILPGLPTLLTVRQAGPAVRGQVVVDADKLGVTYVPPANFIGVDAFTYVATDGAGGTGTGTVSVSVGMLTACDDTVVVTNMGSVVELDVLANDLLLQTAPGDNLVISSVTPTNTAVGPLGIKTGGRRLLFGPATQLGEQRCSYTITDGAGRAAVAALTVLVKTNGVEASPDAFAVLPGSSGNVLDVLRNDATVPSAGKTLTLVSVGTGLNGPDKGGSVELSADGKSLVYVPATGFTGVETFTYTMTDSTVMDTASVVVNVSRGELVANQDRFTVFSDPQDPRQFSLPVTFNDLVVPDSGQAVSIVSLGNGTNAPDQQGQLSIGEDALTLVYAPRVTNGIPEYTERFTYEISDGTERRAQGVVLVRVLLRTNAVDAATQDDVFAVERDSLNNALDVLANDGIRPGLPTGWTITSVSVPTSGGVVSVGSGIVRYSAPAGFVGTDHFTYQVRDTLGGTGEAGVTVQVGGVMANADRYSAISGSESNRLDVLVNDPVKPATGANHHLLDAGAATAGGSVWIEGGQVLYSPLAGYAGPWPYAEDLMYRATDDSGNITTGKATVVVYRNGADRSNAVLHVTVVGVNDPPVISGTVSGQRYFLQGIAPFPGVVISDVDNFGAELQTVTVALETPAHGTLGSLGAFTVVSNGVVRLAGVTPAQASAALRQLVFNPSIAPEGAGAGRVTRLLITTWDGTVSVTDTNTTLIDSPPIEGMVTPAPAVSNANFGSAVAVESNMVISAMASDMSNGTSYVSAYFLAGSAGGGGAWAPTGKVMSVEYQTNGLSGASVALEGDVLVVGAPMVVTGGVVRTGAAYVYYRHQGGSNKWGLVKKLKADDGESGDEYGNAVAISGNTLVVGAFHDNWNSSQNGSVYVYSRNQGGADQWGLVKKLVLGDGNPNDFLGRSVAVSGDILAVGAPMRDDMGVNSGAVYIYMKDAGGTNQWGQVLKKLAPDAAASNEFGTAVAVVGDLLAVGAPGESQSGTNSGAVYLFSRNEGGTNQWGQIKKIRPTDGSSKQEFGCALGMDSNWLAVGSRNDLVSGVRKGSAYLYTRTYPGLETWGFVRKFTTGTGAAGDEYGQAVAVGSGVLAVGARYHGVPVYRCGATYIYTFKYNNAPVVTAPVPDQVAVVGIPFGLILPPTTFSDTDFADTVTLSADYSQSPGLGTWLTFDPASGSFSGTPAVAGTNTVRIVACDKEGASVTNSFKLVVVDTPPATPGYTPLGLWRDLYFGGVALQDGSQESWLWGDQADPDGDGVPNLVEYCFGMNPRIAESGAAGQLTLAPLSSASQWTTITFRRRSGDWYLTTTLEVSDDLVTWQPIGSLLLGERVTPLVSGIDLVTQDVLIPGPLATRQFYRLRITGY